MRSKLSVTIIALLFNYIAYSQKQSEKIKWWEKDKSFGNFIAEENDAYVFSFWGGTLEIRKKDFSGTKLYESKKDPSYSAENYRPNSFISFNDQIYGMSTIEEKDSVFMYAHKFNIESMSASPSGVKLATLPIRSKWKTWKNIDAVSEINPVEADPIVKASNDKSFLLIKSDEPENRDANLKVHLSVFNNELKNQWTKDVDLSDFTWKSVACSQTMITNEGNVFFIITSYKDKLTERVKDYINYKYYLVGVFNNGNDKIVKELSFDNKTIRNVILNQDVSGEVLCGGFYSNEGKYDVNGTYFYKLNSTNGTEISSGKGSFDLQLDEIVNEKEFKESLGGNWHYPEHYLKEIYTRSDGGIYLISEKRYNKTGGDWKYYFDFLVVSYDNSGKLQWQKNFYRYQISPDIYMHVNSTLCVNFINDKVFIYTNSDLDNFNSPENKKDKEFYKEHRAEGNLIKFIIDETGHTDFKKICKLQQNDERFQVESVIPLDNETILGYKCDPVSQRFGVLKVIE